MQALLAETHLMLVRQALVFIPRVLFGLAAEPLMMLGFVPFCSKWKSWLVDNGRVPA